METCNVYQAPSGTLAVFQEKDCTDAGPVKSAFQVLPLSLL
jgi:hypothetical protein